METTPLEAPLTHRRKDESLDGTGTSRTNKLLMKAANPASGELLWPHGISCETKIYTSRLASKTRFLNSGLLSTPLTCKQALEREPPPGIKSLHGPFGKHSAKSLGWKLGDLTSNLCSTSFPFQASAYVGPHPSRGAFSHGDTKLEASSSKPITGRRSYFASQY